MLWLLQMEEKTKPRQVEDWDMTAGAGPARGGQGSIASSAGGVVLVRQCVCGRISSVPPATVVIGTPGAPISASHPHPGPNCPRACSAWTYQSNIFMT